MIGQVILEGVGLGAMLMLVCAIGIRNGAVYFYLGQRPFCRGAAGAFRRGA